MIYSVWGQCLLFNLRLNPGEMTCSAHKFSATLPFCDDITQNTSAATCFYNWLHFHLWFVSNPAALCFSIRCGASANAGELVKHRCVLIGRDWFRVRYSFLVYCIITEGPSRADRGQWTLATRPIECPTDCVISAPTIINKQSCCFSAGNEMVDGGRGDTQPSSELWGQVKCALIPGSIYFFYNLPLKRHQLSDGAHRGLTFSVLL